MQIMRIIKSTFYWREDYTVDQDFYIPTFDALDGFKHSTPIPKTIRLACKL